MLEGEGYYIHMLSDTCFTSTKTHVIALRCHTGIYITISSLEKNLKGLLASSDMCPYINSRKANENKGVACTKHNSLLPTHLESSGLRWSVVAADSAIPVRRMVRAERADAWE